MYSFVRNINGNLILFTIQFLNKFTIFYDSQQDDPSKIMQLATFTMSICGEIYMQCYYGNELTLTSRKFSTSLFHSEWLKSNMKNRKSVTILMENFKKEMKIELFGVYKLNLSSFTTIMNSAYSYLMLLRRLRAKDVLNY